MNRIITISRQFGSGGRTIGRMVGEKLGIPCYDQELLEQLAEKSGFAKEYIKEHDVEYLIFGHRHILLDLMLTHNNRMVILGDWIKHFSYATFDGNNLFIDLFVDE